MLRDLFSGAAFFIRGIKLTAHPELRLFVAIPLLINILVFSAAIWLGVSQFSNLLNSFMPQGDSRWLEYARTAIWILFGLIILIILFFSFTIIANLIGSPFNGLLSERAEAYLSAAKMTDSGGFRELMSSIVPSLLSELKKLLYFLALGLGLFLILLVPGINMLSPVAWLLFSSWMLSLEYIAYPMENHRIFFSSVRKEMKKKKAVAFGFGIMVLITSMVPLLNFLVMPAAVIGATVMYVERFSSETVKKEL